MRRQGTAYVLREPGRPLVREERTWEAPPDGHVLLEVLGCGVCHTDLGFADGHVRPVAPLPLVLGHEIVGRVRATGRPELAGRVVLVPAVAPCGRCAACRRGRATSCARGVMPGNDADGAFASHVVVPDRGLVVLDEERIAAADLSPWALAPLADAATTAWQAIVRAGLETGDVAVFIGVGGVGGFGVQLARSAGARTVAVDVDARRLQAIAPYADLTIDATGLDPREVRAQLSSFAPADAVVRVFETSGVPAGQLLAFALLGRGGSLSIVGFTPEKVPLRLSNVMALDAELHGNWGADPALYPDVVERALDRRIDVRPFVERRALGEVNDVLDALRRGALARRAVLVPEGGDRDG